MIYLERLLELPVLQHTNGHAPGAGALLAEKEQPLRLLLLGIKQVVEGEVKLVGDANSSVLQGHGYLQPALV